MAAFDRKLKKMAKDLNVSSAFSDKVDATLEALPFDEEYSKENTRKTKKRTATGKYVFRIAFCVLLIFVLLAVNHATKMNANVFTTFKKTIMDFFDIRDGESPQDLGVESDKTSVVSKLDLQLELTETIVDSSSIYMLVRIQAPVGVELKEDVTFDYFAFSYGSNYNANQLISGATDCKLLETAEKGANEAIYVVSLSSETEIEDGSEITAYFKDLMIDPYGENRKMLVEGMWSLTFSANYTVSEKVEINGTADMAFPFVNAKAVVKKIKISPLGMTIRCDVSAVPYDDLGISDTSMRVRLLMLDGSEMLLMSHDLGEEVMVNTSSCSYSDKDGKIYQTNKYEFKNMVNTEQVLGVYIEDLYVPVKCFEEEE